MEEGNEVELQNVEIEAGEIIIKSIAQTMQRSLETFKFNTPQSGYTGSITEVQLGATKKEGGTRDSSIKLGGHKTMPFWKFEENPVNKPVFSFDTFDDEIHLPRIVRDHYAEYLGEPVELAKFLVKKYDAEMITLHLVSTDPLNKDRKPKDAADLVEELMKEVKVPMIISGSGNVKKDPLVMEEVAKRVEGERVLLSSAVEETAEKFGELAKKHNHAVLCTATMNKAVMKKTTSQVMKSTNNIIMDSFTSPLGYGIEYSISTMESIRQSALAGDKELQFPMLSGSSNAWAAREAWSDIEGYGPKEYRGVLWEVTTALTAMLSGAEVFMMLNPSAIVILRNVRDMLIDGKADLDFEKLIEKPKQR